MIGTRAVRGRQGLANTSFQRFRPVLKQEVLQRRRDSRQALRAIAAEYGVSVPVWCALAQGDTEGAQKIINEAIARRAGLLRSE